MQLNTAQCNLKCKMQLNAAQYSSIQVEVDFDLYKSLNMPMFAQCELYDESSIFFETQYSAQCSLIQLIAVQCRSMLNAAL